MLNMIGITLILVCCLASLEAFTVSVKNYDGEEVTHVEISCEITSESLHYNFSKVQLTVSEINTLNIHYCGSPPDGSSLLHSLSSLGVNKVKHLTIEDPKSPLTREFLKDLSLDTLEFKLVDVSTLPGDLLRDVQVRENLIITEGNVSWIPQGLFQHVSNINKLEISVNQPVKLRRDDLASLTHLKELVIYDNRLVEIDEGAFNGLGNLEKVDLSHNRLQVLPAGIFHKLKNLREILLSVNDLREIPTDLLHIEDSKFEIFRMNNIHGGVKSLPAAFFKDLRNLKIVQLNKNGLTSLPADLFSGANSLRKVGLRSNKIAELPAGILVNAAELKELDLTENELTSFPEKVFSKNKLQKLYLDNNKITSLTEGNLNGLDELQLLSVAMNPLSNVEPSLCNKRNLTKRITGLRRCP